MRPRTGLAVWSLVPGIVGVVLAGPFTGVPACRAVGAGTADNGGLATAGIVLGAVPTTVRLLVVLLVIAPLLLLGVDGC